MRGDLEQCRGPLHRTNAEGARGEAAGQSVEGNSVDEDAEKTTAPPLLHIWVPSVFLSGAHGKAHHVYQVYLRIKEEEWNIFL